MIRQSLSEIEKAIHSNDEAVLLRSLDFAYKCRQREYDRGRMAEARATATLAILGVLVALLVPQGGSLPDTSDGSFWFLAISYVVPLTFLLAGIAYAFKGLGPIQGRRVEVDTVFEFQSQTLEHVLRSELAAVVWECKNAIKPNTTRLWYLERCQRNGLLAVFSLAVFGVGVLVTDKLSIEIHWCIGVVYSALAVLALIFERKVFQRVRWSSADDR